jgi:hypothetical protein
MILYWNGQQTTARSPARRARDGQAATCAGTTPDFPEIVSLKLERREIAAAAIRP